MIYPNDFVNKIVCGDSIELLKQIPDNTIDLIATDPPYGYSFMGKDWDRSVPSIDIWKECLRVLRSGAFAFIMSSPRQDVLSKMIIRLKLAKFNIAFTSIYWTYATGFPKAMNIGKNIDKKFGNMRKIVKEYKVPDMHGGNSSFEGSYGGFQPKPAVEIILVCMKPLSEGNFISQALDNRHGIVWFDRCRIPGNDDEDLSIEREGIKKLDTNRQGWGFKSVSRGNEGRFPSNLIIEDGVLFDYSKYFSLDNWWAEKINKIPQEIRETFPFMIIPKADGSEKDCGNDNIENRPFGKRKQIKCKTCGCMTLIGGGGKRLKCGHNNVEWVDVKTKLRGNIHPTVKPLKLMTYLVTLGSEEDSLVLDPFVGSGTTSVACKMLHRNYIGIDIDKNYCKIAQSRLNQTYVTERFW